MSDIVGAKAIALVQRSGIVEITRVRAFRAQGSGRERVVMLAPGGGHCDCPAGQSGRRCYHLAAARLLVARGGERRDVDVDRLLDDDALDAVAKILHTFGCVPDCPDPPHAWRPNARIVIQAAIDAAKSPPREAPHS